jgi:REP element-mobilizing transposase RayT
MNKIDHGHLPRLNAAAYRGFAVVHWAMTIRDRRTGWLNAVNHVRLREALLHTAVKYDLLCPVYCLMPDHVHLIWMGLNERSDQLGLRDSFGRRRPM